jgi:hypothetical protein
MSRCLHTTWNTCSSGFRSPCRHLGSPRVFNARRALVQRRHIACRSNLERQLRSRYFKEQCSTMTSI